jgi:hypothetical protein
MEGIQSLGSLSVGIVSLEIKSPRPVIVEHMSLTFIFFVTDEIL